MDRHRIQSLILRFQKVVNPFDCILQFFENVDYVHQFDRKFYPGPGSLELTRLLIEFNEFGIHRLPHLS